MKPGFLEQCHDPAKEDMTAKEKKGQGECSTNEDCKCNHFNLEPTEGAGGARAVSEADREVGMPCEAQQHGPM